jgi:hypothetical protein
MAKGSKKGSKSGAGGSSSKKGSAMPKALKTKRGKKY